MRILMAGSEMSPFVRTGGLGEAIAGIAEGVASLGHAVTVAMPAYRHLRAEGIAHTGHDGTAFRVWQAGAVEVMAFDAPELFDRSGIYGDEHGTGYDDQWVRFGSFSAAVAGLAAEFDVLHIHDAHAGAARARRRRFQQSSPFTMPPTGSRVLCMRPPPSSMLLRQPPSQKGRWSGGVRPTTSKRE